MKHVTYLVILTFLGLFISGIYSCQKDEDTNDPAPPTPTLYDLIEIKTVFGDFYMWLHDSTTLHKENFIKLTKEEFYDSIIFHRVIKNFVVQGGDPTGTGSGGPGYTVPAEFDSNLTHIYGAVGAARKGDNVNPEKKSSGSQFYIVQDTNGEHHLDMEYTVFGQVIKGMDVVDQIALVAVGAGYKPREDVHMLKVSVLELTKEELLQQYQFAIPE